MAIHFRPNAPPSPAVGDVWIQNSGVRQRCTSLGPPVVWEPVEVVADAPDPGVVAGGGTLDQHIAKAAATYGQTKWVNASEGLVFTHSQATPADEWVITHRLINRLVDVTVIDTSRNDTIMIPSITYNTSNSCTLRFAEPVSGTALVRR